MKLDIKKLVSWYWDSKTPLKRPKSVVSKSADYVLVIFSPKRKKCIGDFLYISLKVFWYPLMEKKIFFVWRNILILAFKVR